ncbi:MAG: hypothetical protein ABFS41_02635 [Myxococcota bacterium]
MSVQKRLRERKKAEKAELKRMAKRRPEEEERPSGTQVAEHSDLEAYGMVPPVSDPRNES